MGIVAARYFDAEVARRCAFFVQGFPLYEIGRQRFFPPVSRVGEFRLWNSRVGCRRVVF